MARHPVSNQTAAKEGEELTILNNEMPDEIELPPVNDAETAVVKADATAKTKPPVAPVEKKYYRVIKGGMALMPTGIRSIIKEGKMIDNLNYDIRRLQQQGIRLERADTESSALPFVE